MGLRGRAKLDNSKQTQRVLLGEKAEIYRPSWEEMDLGGFLNVLLRRKFIIIGTVIIITGLASIFAFTWPPQYTSKLHVVFDAKEQSAIDIGTAANEQPQDEATLLSEIEVMMSRSLAGSMVDKLGLINDPEFNDDLTSPNIFAKIFSSDIAAPVRERVIDAVIKATQILQSGRSRAVEVDFTSTDPVKAAVIANTLGELFLAERLVGKLENAQRASRWLAEQIKKLREQAEITEKKAADYRQEHDLLQGERVTLLTEQISALNSQLSDTRLTRTEAEANLGQAQRVLSSPDKLSTTVQVLESTLIQRLSEEQSALARREAAMMQDVGPNHPQRIQLREERKNLLADIDKEVRKIISSLENKMAVARRQEALIVDELSGLKAQMAKANAATVGLRTLERDAEISRLMLEKFMNAFVETAAQDDVSSQLPDARIISTAAVPNKPSSPNKPLIIVGSFAFSVLAALLLALSLERLDAGFHSAEQFEQEVGLPVIAQVPIITGGNSSDPAQYIIERPDSAFGESIRSLFTRLFLASQHSPPQVVLITSAEPMEGKTSISLSLARMLAKAGRKVVLIDADFRKSPIADILKVKDSPGMMELMNGTASIGDSTRKDEATGLDVVVKGTYHSEALHALTTSRIDGILDDLRTRYDFIIIDSAPVLAISDAQIFAAVADETILVVRWGTTRREVAAFAAHQLKGTTCHLGSAILSQVDIIKQARYNYGDSSYYSGKAQRYYST